MKRIDDKIKEIEKKDKKNRILYIGFIVLIAVFMIFAFRTSKTIKTQGNTIDKQDQTILAQLETEKKLADSLQTQLTALNNSLRPIEYWDQIDKDKSVESYIDYITNDWGIHKPQENVVKAYETLHSDNLNVELKGWIYSGKVVNGKFIDNRCTVVWRNGGKNVDGKSKPKVNDIIRLVSDVNLITYKRSKTNLSGKNSDGWRPGTKAFVAEVEQKGIEIRIKIKYY